MDEKSFEKKGNFKKCIIKGLYSPFLKYTYLPLLGAIVNLFEQKWRQNARDS